MFQMETARLVLREWQEDEWLLLRPIATDAEVMRYISDGVPWTDEQIRAFVRRQIGSQRAHGFALWALIEKKSGQLVGHCGIQHLGNTGEVEIGWWLAKHRWDQGLATEAARRALKFAFETARLARITAIAHPQNAASIAIMKKLRMKFERHYRGHEIGLRYPEARVVLYAVHNPDTSCPRPLQ